MKHFLISVIAVFALAAPAFATAPLEAIPPIPQTERKEAPKPPARMTKIQGRLYCSEYGSRYDEPVKLVLVQGADSYEIPFGEIDGSFQGSIPMGGKYLMRVEFAGHGLDIGQLEIPADAGPEYKKFIEIYHPGSLLELIYEIRDGGQNTIEVRLKEI